MAGEEIREPLVLGAESPEDMEVLKRLLARRRRPSPAALRMNMTPMIDIVFQLIIFFMIVIDMSQKDLEALELPMSKTAVEDEPEEGRLYVNINRSGSSCRRSVHQRRRE